MGGIAANNTGSVIGCESKLDVEHISISNSLWNSGYGSDYSQSDTRIGGIVGINGEKGVVTECSSHKNSLLNLQSTGNMVRVLYASMGIGINRRSATATYNSAFGTIKDNGTFSGV